MAAVAEPGWLNKLTGRQREVFRAALAGWLKRADVGAVRRGPLSAPDGSADFASVKILWEDWVAFWNADAAGHEPAALHGTAEVLGAA